MPGQPTPPIPFQATPTVAGFKPYVEPERNWVWGVFRTPLIADWVLWLIVGMTGLAVIIAINMSRDWDDFFLNVVLSVLVYNAIVSLPAALIRKSYLRSRGYY